MLRQDFIGRLIQQLAEALARIAKLNRKDEAEQVEAELASAESALGIFQGMDRLDTRSVSLLLGGGDKVVLAAQLLEQRALLAVEQSDLPRASKLRQRARELLSHAQPKELAGEAKELHQRLSS
ncbi:MAG TPA: hypothetical protein PKA88_21660 [Polyangiaceae bacterium]|nr:hypothetical protein [Polyangiaceae bacterium]HMR73848.1 hypothetical protein [Polyangiaceae bacterium]